MKIKKIVKLYVLIVMLSLSSITFGALPFASSSTPSVQVTIPKPYSLSINQTIMGQVIAKNEINLVARVAGFLQPSLALDGAVVKKGQIIYQINASQYQQEFAIEKANYENSKLNYQNELLEFSRQKQLLAKKATSKQSYDIAELNLKLAQTDVNKSKANLELARLNLSYTKIMAPFTGKLGFSRLSTGALISSSNTTLNTLTELDPIEVEFYPGANLYLKNVSDNPNFQSVKVNLVLADGKKYPSTGQIIFINNQVDSATDTIMVKAEFANPKGILLPGQTVSVSLFKAMKKEVLLIPQKALNFSEANTFVYTLSDKNMVVKAIIKTGKALGKDIIILSGLKKSDRVIDSGLNNIKPGMTVEIIKSISQK